MQAEIREVLDKTCDLFNAIDEKIGIMQKAAARGELCSILKYELLSFLMCLSASDGRISRIEAKLIRDYFDVEIYPGDIKRSIIENNIGSNDYYSKVPQCLKIAIAIDNHMIENDQQVNKGVSEIVIELFKILGKEMVVADEKVKAEEQIAWGKYITMMTQYLVDNSLIYKQRPNDIPRPGTPIEVDYKMSLKNIGRIYTLYIGRINCEDR